MKKAKNKIPFDGYHTWTFVLRDKCVFDLIDMAFSEYFNIYPYRLISFEGEVYRKPIHKLKVRHFPANSNGACVASIGLSVDLKDTFIIYLKDDELDMEKLCNKLAKYFIMQ